MAFQLYLPEFVRAYFDNLKKEIDARNSAISSIKSQVLDQWKQLGVPSIGGGLSIDERAQGLAERLYANQITDLKNLGLTSTTRSVPDYGGDGSSYIDEPASYLTYNGRQIGFLGDIGTAENWQPTGYLQPGNLASWGAQGKGAVGYTVQQAPNGQVYFIPSWGSTSDVSTIAPVLAIGAGLLAPGLGTAIASTLGTSAAVGSALASGVIGGTMAEATGGDFLKGALAGGLGSAASGIIAPAVTEAVGGGMLGSAIGQGATSAGLAALQGGDVGQAALLGAASGAANYTPPAQGMNSPLTPAQIESGLGTEGYGTGAAAQESGLFTTPPSINVDYSITPPVSSPIVPDIGAQGLLMPDVSIPLIPDIGDQWLLTPVEPIIPDMGAQGLLMPTEPIIPDMGAQGLQPLVEPIIPDMGAQGIIVPLEEPIIPDIGTQSIIVPSIKPIIPEMGAQGLQPPVEPIIPEMGAQGLLTPDVSIPLIPDMGAQGIIVPPAYTPPVEYIPEVSTVGSGAYTQTSYPIDMAEFAAADAIQLMNQGIGIPAVEQNLVASGLDPLIAADLTQQISLDPTLTSNDLANNLISTYGSNIYDTTIDQINAAAPQSTEPVPQVTSADINWRALAKGLVGLLGAGAASQMASQPAVQQQARPAYKPVDNMPTYSPEYFQQIQQYYNTYLPSTPRDVATPLQDWYSSGYEKPDSVTAKLFSGG